MATKDTITASEPLSVQVANFIVNDQKLILADSNGKLYKKQKIDKITNKIEFGILYFDGYEKPITYKIFGLTFWTKRPPKKFLGVLHFAEYTRGEFQPLKGWVMYVHHQEYLDTVIIPFVQNLQKEFNLPSTFTYIGKYK